MNIERRQFLVTVGTGLALSLVAGIAPAVEAPVAIAPHQVIRLPHRSEYDDAPVVSAVSLSPSGELVATAGDDHLVWIWRTSSAEMVRKLRGHDDWVRTLAFHPSGDFLASAGDDGRVFVWNVATGSVVHRIGGRPAADGPIKPISATGQPKSADCIYRVLYSPDGSRLVAAGYQGAIRLYDASTGQFERKLDCPAIDTRAVMFSPDGKLLAAGGGNGRVRVWNVVTGQVVRDLDAGTQRVRAVAFSADGGRIAAAGDGPFLRVWEVDSGAELHAFVVRPGRILSLVFCGPGEVATGSSDNVIRVWKLDTEQESFRLVGHEGSVSALEFNPADNSLVSGSFDTTVRFWKLPSASTAATARNPDPKTSNQ